MSYDIEKAAREWEQIATSSPLGCTHGKVPYAMDCRICIAVAAVRQFRDALVERLEAWPCTEACDAPQKEEGDPSIHHRHCVAVIRAYLRDGRLP